MATVIEAKERTIADIIKDLKDIQKEATAGLGGVYDEASKMSTELMEIRNVSESVVGKTNDSKERALRDVAGKASVLRKRIVQDIALMILALEDAEAEE